MANRDSLPRGNGTSWSSIMAAFESIRSREAESSTATAATTRTSPRPKVPPPGVEFDQASPPGIYAAMRQGPEALEAFLDHQIPNYRDGPRYQLASSVRESAESINRQNEQRIQLEQRIARIHSEERIRFNDDRFHNSIAAYERDVGRDVGSESTFNNSIANYERDVERDVGSESTLAAETPNVTPNAAKYLSELQPIAVNDLPEDGRICAICTEPYNRDEDPEQACKVGDCGHVLGRTCLSTWVMPAGSRPNTTCPLCRAALFEDDTPDPSEDFDDEDELNEEVYDGNRMANGRYASGMLDPAILAVISRPQGQQAWDDLRAQWLERAGAEIAQPPYMLSEYVLFYFRRFVRVSNLDRGARERWAAISAGESVRRIMGQIYVRLREDMERTAMPIVWTENGPPLSSLLREPATRSLIETALERLVDIELQRYAAGL